MSAARDGVDSQDTLMDNYFRLRSLNPQLNSMNKRSNIRPVELNFNELIQEIDEVLIQTNCQNKKDNDRLKFLFGLGDCSNNQYLKKNSSLTDKTLIKENKAKGQQNRQSPILAVRPKQNFCVLCRQTFLDYFEHIENAYHLQNCSKSTFNRQIRLLIQKDKRKQHQIKYLKMDRDQYLQTLMLGKPMKRNNTKNTNPTENLERIISTSSAHIYKTTKNKKRKSTHI